MSSANMVDSGTVHTHSSTVFFRQLKNFLYLTTFTKLPKPSWKVSPPAAFRPE